MLHLSPSYSMVLTTSATLNWASVLARTSSSSTPGANSVSVKPPPFSRSTSKTHCKCRVYELACGTRKTRPGGGGGQWQSYQLSDNRADNLGPRQRQMTLLYNLGRAVFGAMLCSHHNLGVVRVCHQVHSASHAFEDFTWDHVVGQIPIGTNLESLWERFKQVSWVEKKGGVKVDGERNLAYP